MLVRGGFLKRVRVPSMGHTHPFSLLSPPPSPQSSLGNGLCLNIFGSPWVYDQFLDGVCLNKGRWRIWFIFLYRVRAKNILLSLSRYFKTHIGKSF